MITGGYFNEICMCPICFVYYDGLEGVPVVGACGHTICRICSVAIAGADESNYACPICGRISAQPLSPNFELMNVLSVLQYDILFVQSQPKLQIFSPSDVRGTDFNKKLIFSCNKYDLNVMSNNDMVVMLFSQHMEPHLQEPCTYPDYHHPHIATLRGHCVSNDTQAFVFEGFANGTLHERLFHCGEGVPSLNAAERFGVAVETARALVYMHREWMGKRLGCRQHGGSADEPEVLQLMSVAVHPQHIGLDHTLTVKVVPPCLWGEGEDGGGSIVSTHTPPPTEEQEQDTLALSEREQGVSLDGEDPLAGQGGGGLPLYDTSTGTPGGEEHRGGDMAEGEVRPAGETTSRDPTDIVTDTCGSNGPERSAVVQAYGVLLLVLLLNISHQDAMKVVTELQNKIADSEGDLGFISGLNEVLASITFTDDPHQATPDLSADGSGSADSALRGEIGTQEPIWDRRTARLLVNLALECALGGVVEHRGPTNMIQVSASLHRIQCSMVPTTLTSPPGGRQHQGAAKPPPAGGGERRVRRSTDVPPPAPPRRNIRHHPVPVPAPPAPDRQRHVNTGRESLTRPIEDRGQRQGTRRTYRAHRRGMDSTRDGGEVNQAWEHEQGTAGENTVETVPPEANAVPTRGAGKVYYHPGYFHERTYTKRSRFGGSVEVPSSWRCCGATQRSKVGCMYALEVRHHPGRWLGDGRFDCCSSLSKDGCVAGPQPDRYRSRTGF